MKRSPEKSEASKQKMIQAAGAAFREHGLGGIGVDGLAKAADFTSGAFYFHFDSKVEAFIESMKANLDDLKRGIEEFQQKAGASWIRAFASFYLGFKRTCDLRDGCAVPLLSAEVERAGDAARAAYELKINEVFAAAEKGLASNRGATSREQALVLLALLAGGVTLSRTVRDPALSEEIARAVQNAVDRLAAPTDESGDGAMFP